MALDMFEEMVSRYRMLWLSGRYGGGKTSLAVYLAARFCQEGWTQYICSNTPLRLEEVARLDPRDVHDVVDAVILMDESWRYVGEGSERHVRDWMAYMRKRNQVLLMPSVMNVARQLRMLRIERRFNGLVFGIPCWWYTWFLNSAVGKEKQHWFWWRPTRVFNLYDHSLPEMDDFVLYKWGPPSDNTSVRSIEAGHGENSGDTDIVEGIAVELEHDHHNSGVRGGGLGGG